MPVVLWQRRESYGWSEFIDVWGERVPSVVPTMRKSFATSLTRFFPSWRGASETQMVLWSLFFSFHKIVRVEVVSLLCVRLAKEFFTVVSGLPDEEVVTYFRRTLSGLKVSLIVDDEKKLLLKYNFRSGHVTLCFPYGEWNKLGHPQHH